MNCTSLFQNLIIRGRKVHMLISFHIPYNLTHLCSALIWQDLAFVHTLRQRQSEQSENSKVWNEVCKDRPIAAFTMTYYEQIIQFLGRVITSSKRKLVIINYTIHMKHHQNLMRKEKKQSNMHCYYIIVLIRIIGSGRPKMSHS